MAGGFIQTVTCSTLFQGRADDHPRLIIPYCATGSTLEFIPICGRNSRGSSSWLTRYSTSVGCGSTMSLGVSSAVAASQTEAAYGRWASAIGCGISAVPGIMPGSSSPWAAESLIEINSTHVQVFLVTVSTPFIDIMHCTAAHQAYVGRRRTTLAPLSAQGAMRG